MPSIALGDFKKYSFREHISILKNERSLQAVFQKDLKQVQAVFFNSGKLELPWNNLVILFKKPGLVILKKVNNTLIIDYSQPVSKKHIALGLDHISGFQNDEIELLEK